MKKIILYIILFIATGYAQNLTYELVEVDSLQDSIYVDLGVDNDVTIPEYPAGTENRAIGIIFFADSTLTNDTLVVNASMTDGGTYYPVYGEDGTQLVIKFAANHWVWLKPIEYAGLRYLLFSMSAQEAGPRHWYIVRRRY